MRTKPPKAMPRPSAAKPAKHPARVLVTDVREMIQEARAGLARAVDSGLVTLYWHVGRRIRQDILKARRAEYGEKIVSALGTQLSAEFGRGFGERNLFRMVRFAEVFPAESIVSALRTLLGWTHFRQIIALDDPLKRDYLVKPCDADELAARLHAIVRRSHGRATSTIMHGDLAIDRAQRRVTRDGKAVKLSRHEFRILTFLYERHGRVQTRRQIEDALYGWGEGAESNSIEVHVHNLRRKLGDQLIETVRGVGYRSQADARYPFAALSHRPGDHRRRPPGVAVWRRCHGLGCAPGSRRNSRWPVAADRAPGGHLADRGARRVRASAKPT